MWTATSPITFGFSVYKCFQRAREIPQRAHFIGSRQFGIILLGIGLAALLMATFEYRQNLRSLGEQYSSSRRSLAVALAALISILGGVPLIVMFLESSEFSIGRL